MKKKSGWRGWSIFENNPFIEGFAQWMDSSDGELFDEVRDLTWQSLKNVDVDASARTSVVTSKPANEGHLKTDQR